MRINEIFKLVRSYTVIYCPVCGSELNVIGLCGQVLWCSKCKQCYELHLRKNNRLKEKDLRDCLGFPKGRKAIP